MKSYTTLRSAKSAIVKAGLSGMNVSYIEVNSRCQPLVLCELAEDVAEVRSRGFDAKLVAPPAPLRKSERLLAGNGYRDPRRVKRAARLAAAGL